MTTLADLKRRLATLNGRTYSAAYDAQGDYKELAEDALALAESMEADAGRYRFIRGLDRLEITYGEMVDLQPCGDYAEQIDAALDAAKAKDRAP